MHTCALHPHTAEAKPANGASMAPTRRAYSAGPGMPEVDGQRISQEAKNAAHQGHSLSWACPYPFNTEAGQHFVAVYYLNRRATVSAALVLARSANALELPQ